MNPNGHNYQRMQTTEDYSVALFDICQKAQVDLFARIIAYIGRGSKF